jgi:hypothetical protein
MSKHKKPKTRESDAENRNKKKIRIRGGLCLSVLLLALFIAFMSLRSSGFAFRPSTDSPDTTGNYVRRETKRTLSSALFVGKTAAAYRLAEEIPDVLDRLYCYCHCDKSIGHVSLLSCFTDTHAANCGVCQNEAVDASAMLEKGSSLPEIKRQIDLKYGRT